MTTIQNPRASQVQVGDLLTVTHHDLNGSELKLVVNREGVSLPGLHQFFTVNQLVSAGYTLNQLDRAEVRRADVAAPTAAAAGTIKIKATPRERRGYRGGAATGFNITVEGPTGAEKQVGQISSVPSGEVILAEVSVRDALLLIAGN